MKKDIKILAIIVSFTIAASITISAEDSGGNITVYVLNQKGDKVGKIVNIDVRYEEELVNKTPLYENEDHITIKVNHTGTYSVWAYFTEEFLRDGYNCTEHGFEEGSDECWRSIFKYIETECGCLTLGCAFECENGTHNEEGEEIAYRDLRSGLYYSCREIQPNYFNKVYRIALAGYSFTHVEDGEEDKVRVTILTEGGDRRLWDNAKRMGRNNLYKINQLEKLIQDVWVDSGKDAASELIDAHVTSPILKDIFKDSVKGGIVSSIVVDTAEALTDPDELFTTEGQTKYTIDAGSGAIIAYYGLGWQVAIPVFIGRQVIFAHIDEEKRCRHMETDDLKVMVNPPENSSCDDIYVESCMTTWGTERPTECNGYQLSIINLGDPLYDVHPTSSGSYISCLHVESSPPKIDVNNNEVEKMYSRWKRAIKHKIPADEFVSYTNVVYYTAAQSIPDFKKCMKKSTLGIFGLDTPYVTEVSYPKMAYPNDNVVVSVRILDGYGVDSEKTFIVWNDIHAAQLSLIEGDIFDGRWIANFSIPVESNNGDLIKFVVYAANDNDQIVNDNDQQLFKIKVIEDTDYGGDVPDVKEDAYRVAPSAFERSGWLWPQPEESFGTEQDWYKVHVEKGKNYLIDAKTNKPLKLRVDKPNAPSENFTILCNQGSISFNHSSSGFLYLGFIPLRIIDYGMNYSFKVEERGFAWFDPYTKTIAYYTPFQRYFYFVCAGLGPEGYPCEVEGSQTLGIHDVSAWIHEISGYDPYDPTPGQQLYPDVYTAEDCNGDEKEYMDVKVAFYPYTGYGGVTVQYIQPVIDAGSGWKEDIYECDRTTIDTFVPDDTTEYFTAKVPIIDSDGDYYVKMKVYYRSTHLPYFTYTEPFAFNLDVRKAPTLNNFTATVGYNSVELEVDASDDEELKSASFYFDGGFECYETLDGKSDTASCIVDTSSLTDNSVHQAYVKVRDTEFSWFESDILEFTVRNDIEKPIILSTYILPTENGEVYNNNVSGTVMLGVSTYDTESGIQSIEWYKNGVYLGSGATLNWITTTEADGFYNIQVDVTDLIGNSDTKTFTVNVDNTPPVILDTIPENGDILEGIVGLEVNVTDLQSGLWDTEWFLEGVKIGSGMKTIWGSAGLDGSYTLTVNVSDVVGNIQSEDIPVIIRSPDLAINASDVTITDNNITAIIRNLGSADASDVNVSFYAGNESFASEIINVSARGSEIVVVDYTPTGKDITVVADPYDWITEIDEWNNYVIVEALSCPNGGISTCEGTFCCGEIDGICPEDFDNVTCIGGDPDCCSDGGFYACGKTYCCGDADGICPSDFDGVNCTAPDPDCCSDGGISTCYGTFCCGVEDGICPEWFDGVNCTAPDPDCCEFGGISTCQGTFCCSNISDGICPEDFDNVSCSIDDVDCY